MSDLLIKESGQLIIKETGTLIIKESQGDIIIVTVLAFAWLGLMFFIYARLGKFGLWNKVKKGDNNGKEKRK